ncbi:MAG: hypothetical protein ACFFDN_32530 [Candidatus Hodarchaeota archaeon]
MARILKNNKYIIIVLIVTVVFTGLTFRNLPGPITSRTIQTINGITYDFSNYPYLNHEQIGLYNYMRNIIMNEPINSFENWNAEGFEGMLHYMLAFTDYVISSVFETTPGYRTGYYNDTAYRLIEKMNTTIAEYGTESIEYLEWGRTNYPDYYWPNATDPSDLYVGDFRGPANIMWTGHFALIETLYKRSFNSNEFYDEITWFIQDWNNTLTTDGYGNYTDGGIWGTGLINCEPYICFAQCNSIAIYCTELYDNLYGTQYMGMWDYGLNFINTVMHNEYDLFIDGYYVQEPIGNISGMGSGVPSTIPGPAVHRLFDDGRAAESSYSNAWTLTFLEYTQPEKSIKDYPLFLKKYKKEINGEQMFMLGSFNDPNSFGSPNDMLGTFFSTILAKQRGDFSTVQRILNFLTSPYNKIWSKNGRELHYDTTSLSAFLQPVLAGFYIWATTPIKVRDLASPRPVAFWNLPYISQADDEKIWIYQAIWDKEKGAFLLNIKVDDTAHLSFSNFDHIPTAYSGSKPVIDLSVNGTEYILTLEPGKYNLVII